MSSWNPLHRPQPAHVNGNTTTPGTATNTGPIHINDPSTGRITLNDPNTRTEKSGRHGRHRSRSDGRGRPKMTFGLWFRLHWLDLLTMAAMGAIGLGVYEANPAPSRSFPLNFSDGEIVYPQFAYPLRKEIIPIWLAALLAFIIPFVFFVLAQIRVRSFEDLNTATFGLLWSLITAAVFQVFIKWLIGGLRPHFLAVCKPVIPAGVVGNGYQSIMFDRSICTGDQNQINDSLESMPSGHSTAAWAGFMFMSLYLNAKLKFMANYRPAYWKMPLCFAPLLGAFLISGALTIDEFHNWYDVVAGGIIGSVCALAAYRASYAAIFDFRFNHIPLPRVLSSHHDDYYPEGFGYDAQSIAMSPARTWTHKGGWGGRGGVGGAGGLGGAPGDAAFTGAGGGAGMGTGTGAGMGTGMGTGMAGAKHTAGRRSGERNLNGDMV